MAIFRFKGGEILVKDFDCSLGRITPKRIAPSVNLFVKVTHDCNCHCRFCSNAGTVASKKVFDVGKLIDILHELRNLGVRVNRVNFTGGEPSLALSTVHSILERISIEEVDDVHLHLNTHGLLSQAQELMRHPRWDSISMSLHHYDLGQLSSIYGVKLRPETFSLEGINRKRLNASCNLIRGYIDSTDKVRRMMDFVLDLDIHRLGFVALMKVNDYCRRHFVDYGEISLESIPHLYFTRSMNRGKFCKCSNYLYNHGLNILEVYLRNYADPNYCASSLVYDGEYLRQGFHSENIVY